MKRVFVDVDTQHDFMMPDGALYVPGAERLVKALETLTEHARQHRVPVIATADAHGPDDPEFAQFRPHCVRGTAGAERIPATRRPEAFVVDADTPLQEALQALEDRGVVVVTKQTIDAFSNPNMGRLIDAMPTAVQFVVYGVATEYCVRGAVEGLCRRGRRVAVVSDAIAGLGAEAHARQVQAFAAAGVQLVSTAEVVMAGHVVELTDANFQAEVLQSPLPVLVDFWAPWCGPCKMMSRTVEQLAAANAGKVKVGKLNTDENQETPGRYGIQAIPTLILFKNGQVVDQFVGVTSQEDLQAAMDRVQ